MSKKDFEKHMTGKVTKAMLALSMMSHLSYAQPRHEDNDISKEKTENIKSARSDEISPTEKSFIFEQRITTENGRQDTTYIINNQEISAQVKDVRKVTEEYKEAQKEAFKNDKFAIERFEIDEMGLFNGLLAAYSSGDKSVNIATIKAEENSSDIFKRLKKDYGVFISDKTLQKAAENTHQAAKINDSSNPLFFSIITHEFQHKNNDKHNIYAPGMTPEQYGQLNQYDEISANLAGVLVLNNIYENKLAAGIPQSEALKTFDNHIIFDFTFYKTALQNGLKPDSEEARWLMVNGTINFWVNNNQKAYQNQINSFMQFTSDGNDVGSLAIGDNKEFKKRINLMFDNLGENEVLKKMHIVPGKFSQYLPEEIIELSPEMKKEANDMTKLHTGLSLEEGQEISRRLPGSQKRDAINLVKILSGRKEAPKSLTQKKSMDAPQKSANLQQALLSKKQEQGR